MSRARQRLKTLYFYDIAIKLQDWFSVPFFAFFRSVYDASALEYGTTALKIRFKRVAGKSLGNSTV